MDEIYKKIAEIRERFPDEDSQKDISSLEKNLKKNNLIVNLKGHDGMKIIIAEFEKEIGYIEKELKDNPDIFKNAESLVIGQVLHARKKWLKKFVGMFGIAETNVNMAVDTINKKLTEE